MASSFKRVQQWATFSRLWYLYDAHWQNPFDSAAMITNVLMGKHKPIYHHDSDVGDHVVVINTKEIAMPGDEWRYRTYFHHTGYPGGASWTMAWELHNKNPTLILYKAVYYKVGGSLLRGSTMRRLHLFPDDNVPPEIMANVSGQLRQLRPVPKRLDHLDPEEVKRFPKVFDWLGKPGKVFEFCKVAVNCPGFKNLPVS